MQESKIQALLQLLHRCLDGTQEKVIIFTEFRDTLDLVERVLTERGYGEMIVTYHGETSPAEREARRYAFLTDRRMRIFLATDAASEGINLHKSCNTLIHIEIPWNPNRYEQRNGRIDRYGQQSRPTVYLLVSPRSVEQRVSQVVVEKLERIGRELGSVANVFPIAQRISIEDFLSSVDTERIEQMEQELPDEATSNPELEQVARQMEQLLDKAQEQGLRQLSQSMPAQVLTGERFGAQERAVIEQQIAHSRAFVPEYQDVEEFLRVFLTLQGMSDGRLLPTREPGIYSVDVPRRLQEELRDAHGQRITRYPRATFQRTLAIQEAEREAGRRAEFLSPGHPLVQMALRYMRGSAFNPEFPSRIAYRRTPAHSTPGFIFTYAVRFVDGRGETIEERFEAVFVALDGTPGQQPDEDMRMFTAQKSFGNLTADEEAQLLPRFQAAFEPAKVAAMAEMQRRRELRREELEQQQVDISEKALMRLGVWEKASQDRLRWRFRDLPFVGDMVQLSFAPTAEERRHATLFERETQRLSSQEGERRRDIRAIRTARGEAIDTIGALVMIPET